ncbi:MAG: endonuclease III [Muribaculaceae bacterium]|nr:endonuclease III [Muribaculaceae bacterium]
MTQKERCMLIVERFRQTMPVAETELHYNNPYQLLVAVILSAQCTDKRVNMITPGLFEAYPDAASLAAAEDIDVYNLIRSVSYPNNKTKSLIGMARNLCRDFGGEVPSTMDELLTLPGVGRKTANVILSVVFGQAAMAVDTHVFRVSERLGLTTRSKNVESTERKLMQLLPREVVATAHHWLILHGRYVCKARKPLCDNCKLTDLCRYYKKNVSHSGATGMSGTL